MRLLGGFPAIKYKANLADPAVAESEQLSDRPGGASLLIIVEDSNGVAVVRDVHTGELERYATGHHCRAG